MQIVLYKTKSANNKLNKTLESKLPIDKCYFRHESNVITPTVTIQMDEEIVGYNYCYIKKFNRYYYITSYESVRTNIFRLHLKCDVLYTYRNEIKNCEALVVHQDDDSNKEQKTKTKYTNKMLNDGTYPVAANSGTEVFNFQNGTDKYITKDTSFDTYIVTVVNDPEVEEPVPTP